MIFYVKAKIKNTGQSFQVVSCIDIVGFYFSVKLELMLSIFIL